MGHASDILLAGIDAGEPLEGPQTLHIDIANACNLACVTCWDHSPLLDVPRPAEWKRQRADPGAVLSLVDEAISLGGLRHVILSGMGEPLTHPAAYDLIMAIRGRNVAVTGITNLLAADMDRLRASAPDELLVGVHGATTETYRAFHPGCGDGAFDTLLARLDTLVADGRSRVKHVQVICGLNAHELVPMVRLARDHGCGRVTFKLASLGRGTERCGLDAAARARLLRKGLPEARDMAAALGVSTNLSVLASQLETGGTDTAPIDAVGCFMGYLYARVRVDGTVLFCCADELVVGSLAESSFADLWNGPKWRDLRGRLREGRYWPACRQCGKLAQNLRVGQRFAARYGEARRRQVCGGNET